MKLRKIRRNYDVERQEMLSIIESNPRIHNYFIINPSLFEVHFDYYVKNNIFYTNVINYDTHYILVENDHYMFRLEYMLKYSSILSYNNVLKHTPLVEVVFLPKAIKGKHCNLKHKDKVVYTDKQTAIKIYKTMGADLKTISDTIASKLNLSDFDSVKQKALLIGNRAEHQIKSNYKKYVKSKSTLYNVNVNNIVSNNDTNLFAIFESDISGTEDTIKKILNRYDQYNWAIDDNTTMEQSKINNDKLLDELSIFGHGKLYLNGDATALSF